VILYCIPLYALYFLILINKRFFYSLRIDKSKKGEINYDFISNANLSENTVKIIFDAKSETYNIGKYIHSKLTNLLNNTKRLLKLCMEPQRVIQEDQYKEYSEILRNIFNIIYDMTLNYTDVNDEWVFDTITKVKNLNELYKGMVLGRSNLFFPTDYHISELNIYIQKIEKEADKMEGNNG